MLSGLLTIGYVLWGAAFLGPASAAAEDIHNGKSVETFVEDVADAKTAEVDPLVAQVDEAIAITSRRRLTAGLHTPWQILHGLLALRQDFRIEWNGEEIAAVDWLTRDATYQGQSLFQVTDSGARARPYTEPSVFEGHRHQFLALLASADLPLEYELKADSATITIADLVRDAQMEFDGTDEITWTLWALSHYLDPDAQWANRWGQHWNVEALISEMVTLSAKQRKPPFVTFDHELELICTSDDSPQDLTLRTQIRSPRPQSRTDHTSRYRS